MEYWKSVYGIKWQLIFRQNSTSLFYLNKDELFFQSPDYNKFSILSLLTDRPKSFGYFEFLLEYPTLSTTSLHYFHWKQQINPLKATNSTRDVGFIPIHVPENYVPFQGLRKNGVESFLDGTIDASTWYYAIGAYQTYNKGIPGPFFDDPNNAPSVPLVNLYLRFETVYSQFLTSHIHFKVLFFMILL